MAGTWGDQNIFQRMTQPVNNPVAGRPPPPTGTQPPPFNRFGQNAPDPRSFENIHEMIQNDTRQGSLMDVFKYINWQGGVGHPYGEGATVENSTGKFGDDFELWYNAPYENDSSSQSMARQYQANIRQGSALDQLNQKYGGIWTMRPDDNVAENGRVGYGFKLDGDYSKLPTTRFGTVDSVQPLTQHNSKGMINPSLAYYDENYGWITPKSNMDPNYGQSNFSRLIKNSPFLLSLVTAGLGSALGGAGLLAGGLNPSTVMGLGQGAAGAFSGNPGRILQSLISAGLPMTGLSGLPLNLARMGSGFFTNMLNQQFRRGRGGG